jgi:predicted DNA-binding transcriptional regulator YafY
MGEVLFKPNQRQVAWRVLRIVITLRKSPRTVKQLAALFGVDKRTIYRDLNFIKDAGVRVEKDKDGFMVVRYRITEL